MTAILTARRLRRSRENLSHPYPETAQILTGSADMDRLARAGPNAAGRGSAQMHWQQRCAGGSRNRESFRSEASAGRGSACPVVGEAHDRLPAGNGRLHAQLQVGRNQPRPARRGFRDERVEQEGLDRGEVAECGAVREDETRAACRGHD